MASPAKTGSNRHEIVGRHDGVCQKCRGRTIAGSRIWWDKDTGFVEHVACPPVVEIAPQVYTAPPVSPDRWKAFCKQIQEAMTGKNTARAVIDEDRCCYETDGVGGVLRSVINRTRCTGAEAVEIVRRWFDSLRAPVDEEKFQRVNQAIGESRRAVASMVAREPGMEG